MRNNHELKKRTNINMNKSKEQA